MVIHCTAHDTRWSIKAVPFLCKVFAFLPFQTKTSNCYNLLSKGRPMQCIVVKLMKIENVTQCALKKFKICFSNLAAFMLHFVFADNC